MFSKEDILAQIDDTIILSRTIEKTKYYKAKYYGKTIYGVTPIKRSEALKYINIQ